MMEILKKLAESNTINFIIMVAILAIIVIKMNLKASMNDSIAKVETSIKQSDETRSNSEKVLSKSKDLYDKLPEDIQKLNEEAVLKTDVFKKQIETSSEKEISGLKNNIGRVISIEEKKISNLIQKSTIENSVLMAENNIKTLLESNRELHRKFIEESLDELDKVQL